MNLPVVSNLHVKQFTLLKYQHFRFIYPKQRKKFLAAKINRIVIPHFRKKYCEKKNESFIEDGVRTCSLVLGEGAGKVSWGFAISGLPL